MHRLATPSPAQHDCLPDQATLGESTTLIGVSVRFSGLLIPKWEWLGPVLGPSGVRRGPFEITGPKVPEARRMVVVGSWMVAVLLCMDEVC